MICCNHGLQLRQASVAPRVQFYRTTCPGPRLTHCSPGNIPNPTPGPLMSTSLVNNGQPTLHPTLPHKDRTTRLSGERPDQPTVENLLKWLTKQHWDILLPVLLLPIAYLFFQ